MTFSVHYATGFLNVKENIYIYTSSCSVSIAKYGSDFGGGVSFFLGLPLPLPLLGGFFGLAVSTLGGFLIEPPNKENKQRLEKHVL